MKWTLYVLSAAKKSDLDRTDLAKDKSGVFTGSYCINPVNGENTGLGGGLCADQLWNWGDHGGTRP